MTHANGNQESKQWLSRHEQCTAGRGEGSTLRMVGSTGAAKVAIASALPPKGGGKVGCETKQNPVDKKRQKARNDKVAPPGSQMVDRRQ